MYVCMKCILSYLLIEGMPEFMKKLRLAAKRMADNRAKNPSLGVIQEPKVREETDIKDPTCDEVAVNDDEEDDDVGESNVFNLLSLFYPPRSLHQYFPYFPLK